MRASAGGRGGCGEVSGGGGEKNSKWSQGRLGQEGSIQNTLDCIFKQVIGDDSVPGGDI